jgi:hypothetical protein
LLALKGSLMLRLTRWIIAHRRLVAIGWIAVARAAVHGYTTAFSWAAGIFAAGALVTGLLVGRKLRDPASGAQPEVQPLGAV